MMLIDNTLEYKGKSYTVTKMFYEKDTGRMDTYLKKHKNERVLTTIDTTVYIVKGE